jgi:glycosyltransferase involved in cell wall biosynthesis
VAEGIIREVPKLTSKVVTIGNAISDEYFSAGPHSKSKTILFVGRIAREKGVHLLLEAFASLLNNERLPSVGDWKLRIVGPHDISQGGDGIAYNCKLTRIARELGVACEMVGPIFDEQTLINEYRSASIFVYPSVAERGEALPLAPLEAMATGCAVIVSNLRCFDDYIENGVSGLVFELKKANSKDDLAKKLELLITDPRLLEEIARRGQLSSNEFRTETIASKMLSDFSALVGGADLASRS